MAVIDPILSLAIAIHSDPGVYAFLVGSGSSRSAGIPTGWEIVLDLIRQLALLMNEDCEPRPDLWYRNRFGEDPDYARLLDEIAKTPAERQQLLRSYFEPNETELEEHLKVPTTAHHAIADLAKRGYVKIVITTNFDRLIEKAFEAAGVSLTVISSTDHILGARPLTHSGCTLLKVNGDYLDTRIKNTPAELASYDGLLNGLLDRIFDEYGLLVVGWSAVWDTALREALERCRNHRFTTFWGLKGAAEDQANNLITRRRAVLFSIDGADSLFQSVSEKVVSLEDISRPHPLSTPVAVATLKRYVSEDRYRIRAHDLVLDEAKKLIVECDPERFPVNVPKVTYDELIMRMRRYEALTDTVLSLCIIGGYWGEVLHESIWSDSLGLISDRKRESTGNTACINLQDYPALLLVYGCGIAAVAAKKYGNLAAILLRASQQNPSLQIDEPLTQALEPYGIVLPETAQKVINPSAKNHTPVNDYLLQTLREPLLDLMPRQAQFENCFNRFEYLWSLIRIDLTAQQKYSSSRKFIGRYLWSDRKLYDYKETELDRLYQEMDQHGKEWPGLSAGLFGGSYERLTSARKTLDELFGPLRQELGIW